MSDTVKFENPTSHVAGILNRFWTFYITGEIPPLSNRMQVLFSTLSIAINPETEKVPIFIFKDHFTQEEGDFPIGELEAIGKEIDIRYSKNVEFKPKGETIISEIRDVRTIAENLPDISGMELKEAFRNFDPNTIKSFEEYISNLILNANQVDKGEEDLIKLLKITTVVCLMCFRGLVKDTNVLYNPFMRNKLITNIENIMGLAGKVQIVPPCLKFIEEIKNATEKNLKKPRLVFSVIVDIFVEERNKVGIKGNNLIGLLSFTCINSTSLNGLTIIKLLQEVRKLLSIQVDDLVPYLYMDTTVKSWEIVYRFLDECFQEEKVIISSCWCRLLEDSYYSYISAESNLVLSTILGSITVAGDVNAGLWKTIWGKRGVREHAWAIAYGSTVYNHFKSTGDQTGAHPKAKTLMGGLQLTNIRRRNRNDEEDSGSVIGSDFRLV